ncbi:ABC transporter ATP-binding protein [Pseudonocardia acaciae]|uniref:ABC transporter ATP-binding protein n=1 Tax=Pseudonocardia acaciae TaxID=551276 RepID=UPI000491F3AC|nr:energy-coupling factor transporter ATPase [Pseudonocardia acaciae]
MTSEIAVDGVTFRYRRAKTPALRGIDLHVSAGQFVAVVGPSQAGKSTLCLALNGLIPRSVPGKLSGEVRVGGRSTRKTSMKEMFTEAAIVFQDFESQLFATSAALDVAFGPENLGLPHDRIVERVTRYLGAVGLEGFERREPSSLSGGQKQRLALASALALESPVLILDEPTTDLDPVGKRSVLEVIEHLRASGEHTIICVEHEIEELVSADRVVLLADGGVVLDGTPAEVFGQVDVMRRHGVMPVGACELFVALGLPPTALGVDEAVAELTEHGYRLDGAVLREQARGDEDRRNRYGEVLIEADHVGFSYDERAKVVDDVSLRIRAGEFVAILGRNGSGKTTLAKQLNGLLRYTEGSIRVRGEEALAAGIHRLSRTIGYVFQNPDSQIFADDVFSEVAFGPRNHGFSEDQVRASVTEALHAVGMTGREKDDPFSLTKGERQRVAVASVLATRPDVLILDEPTTGLDHTEQLGMMRLLRELNEAGATIVIVTHTMWVVGAYAHRAVVMSGGRVVRDGPVREVFAHESELTELSLIPPQITRIGNRLGAPLLTVEEACACLAPAGSAVR